MTVKPLLIEKGVPLPRRGTGSPKYNWHAMKIGDSQLVPTLSAVRAAYFWGARHGAKFETRKMVEKPFGYRVWRVA